MISKVWGNMTAADELLTLDRYKAAFDAHLDAVAREREYDSRLTIATWVSSPIAKYANEAQAYIDWQGDALEAMFEMQRAVSRGDTPAPSLADFIAGLPKIVWPA